MLDTFNILTVESLPWQTCQDSLKELIIMLEWDISIKLKSKSDWNFCTMNFHVCRFLKHLERSRLMLFVVDVQGFQLNQNPYRSAFETIALLNRELELYNPDLIKKPCLCLINKMDTNGAEEKYRELRAKLKDYENAVESDVDPELRPEKHLQFDEIIPISAKFNRGSVDLVKDRLREWVDIADEKKREKIDMEAKLQELHDEKGPDVV